MAIYVNCGSDIVLNYGAGQQSVSLSATASGDAVSTWNWSLLGAPSGINTNQTSGDFTNGLATIQNPNFTTNSGVMGTYVFQCIAGNGITTNSILIDRANAQQNIIVKTLNLGLSLPADSQYDWATEDQKNIVLLSGVWPTTISGLNTKFTDGTVLDASTASRPPSQHALAGSAHSSTTLANLNAKILDATLDANTSSRPPTGSASGDLSGTYPSPVVSKLGGITLNLTTAASGQFITYNSSANQWQPVSLPTTFSSLSDAPSTYINRKYQVLGVNQAQTGTVLAPLMTTWRQNWPYFASSGGYTVAISGRKGFSNNLQLRLNDGLMYTATAPLVINYTQTGFLGRDPAEKRAAGNLWHIYAVPATTASQMSFVMSTRDPITSGPQSYSTYKYCWTVKGTNQSGIFPFNQQGKWNYYTQNNNSTTFSGVAEIFQDSAKGTNLSVGAWWPMDGVTNPSNCMTSVSGIKAFVPMTIADAVTFRTYCNCKDYMSMSLSITPGSGSAITWKPQSMAIVYASGAGDFVNWVNGSGNSPVSAKNVSYYTQGIDPQSLMFSWYFADGGGGPTPFPYTSCTVAGYRNAMYGDFYAEDD